MIAEAGHYALALALAMALIQSTVPVVGARLREERLMAVGTSAALAQFVLVGTAFAALVSAFVRSDFSLLTVYENSHSALPLVYRFTSVWGNHEGSMLLWVLILTLFGALVALIGDNLPSSLKANVLAVQGWISTAFLAFILFTSNPFTRLSPAPFEGRDLNPILQDIGLAIHPPLLYLGYVGFSVAFSFAAAALIEGRVDAAWARWVRPWVLSAWIFLTLGIAMGSYWAYYELGWGGWWFWDPVENASFMPWLAGTALLHSALVMERRDALKVWTVLLAVIAFALSLVGTFLVRSGVLTSVHSFATDPTRGIFILAILCIFIGGAFALFAWRAPTLRQGGLFAPISREGSLVFNNLMLTTACATVLTGTLYPLALEALTGTKISAGAPFFNATFIPLMVPMLIAVPFGPMLAWKRGDLPGAAQRLGAAMVVSIAAALIVAAINQMTDVLAAIGIGLGVWVIAGAIVEIAERIRLLRIPLTVSLARLAGLPRSAWGTTLAHIGLGICVLGIVSATAWQEERVLVMRPGDTTEIAGYAVTFAGVAAQQGPNYTAEVGRFAIHSAGREIAAIESSKRLYTARQMPTTESGIVTRFPSQLYIALGDASEGGGTVVRIWWKPMVTLIWLGAVVMALGGLASLADRRLRVGAPRPARARRAGTMAAAE